MRGVVSSCFSESDQLTWVKWRSGMILQYGNLTILSIQELGEGMFPTFPSSPAGPARHTSSSKDHAPKGIQVFADEHWQEHKTSSRIFGVDIQTPDLYPILKFPEIKKKYQRVNIGGRGMKSHDSEPHSKVEILVHEAEREEHRGHGTNRMVSMDQVDLEFEKLRIRMDMSRSNGGGVQGLGSGSGVDVVWEAPDGGGRVSPSVSRMRRSRGPVRKVRSYDKYVLTSQG